MWRATLSPRSSPRLCPPHVRRQRRHRRLRHRGACARSARGMCHGHRAAAAPSPAPCAMSARRRARSRESRVQCYRIAGHGRRRYPHPLSALRRRNGNARSGSGNALDARPVLGMQSMRPSFLDHVSAACTAEAETRDGTGVMTAHTMLLSFAAGGASVHTRVETLAYMLQDEDDDDDDDDDDVDSDDGDDDDEDEDEDEEEEETWQVGRC